MSETQNFDSNSLKHILEAALLAAGEPLSKAQLSALFNDNEGPSAKDINEALDDLAQDCADRGIELKEVASGFRLQVKPAMQEWVSRLWTEKPARYSRALLETLSLIAYRQPITRGEIEAVRGVSVRSSIIRTLQEREWIRIVGHRDVPGKPALFGTTRQFLDYFDLKSLDELPTLAEIKDMENLEPELDLDGTEQEEDAEADSSDGEPAQEQANDEAADQVEEQAEERAEERVEEQAEEQAEDGAEESSGELTDELDEDPAEDSFETQTDELQEADIDGEMDNDSEAMPEDFAETNEDSLEDLTESGDSENDDPSEPERPAHDG